MRDMKICVQYKWTVLVMVALAITPLLFGHAFHCLIPCTNDFYCGNGRNTLPPEKGPCPVCKLIAMPRDIACHVVCDCILDRVELLEPESASLFVALYCPFEPGRAPPTVA